MTHFTRRGALAALACAGISLTGTRGVGAFGRPLAPPADVPVGRTVPIHLVAAERTTALPCFNGHSLPLWTFSADTWLPIIRVDLGDRLEVSFDNRLPRQGEHTSIHWHGIRLPNAEDGVPYLVQPPVAPGESHRYGFSPPDTGTFWFHTHCNTVEQLGRGLMGVLIIDGDATAPYDADEVIVLRDWRIDGEGSAFLDFTTPRGAHRAGTFGSVRSVNGMIDAALTLPGNGDCRLRLLNVDPTRIMEIAVDGAEAAVLAVDGIAVPPFALEAWPLGPGMRVDLVVRAPPSGASARLVDRRAAESPTLAQLVGTGADSKVRPFDPLPLRASRIPEPDLAAARELSFSFAAGNIATADDPLAADLLGSLCLASEEYWTINGKSWPGRDHKRLPPPLARLKRGRSYVFTLKNATQLLHPIHIHGHSFKVLGSSGRSLPAHHVDTMLLLPDEEVRVAFVADNPGKWMFHCHVIEHQEAGMMAYVEIA